MPEWQELRQAAADLKTHVLAHLDTYLETFEANVIKHGGHVHWAQSPEEARAAVIAICRQAGARKVTKGKSMVTEEIALNDALIANGFETLETDLGEYIIQLRGETPSHLIAPAFHLSKEDVAETFRDHHTHLDRARDLSDAPSLVAEARTELRRRFSEADVGITGANMFIAETGGTVIVTNEGNGDLTQNWPKVHVVVTGIEKVVPTLNDAALILRVLARSATGQDMSVYTTMSTGPKRAADLDGPEEFHVVLLDNGRSRLLGTQARDVLRCIRCAACLNHCPVYGAIGGHAYGWIYSGPIGAALDPGLLGVAEASHLAQASSFCGRCDEVCPVKIPLTRIMRHWRNEALDQGHVPSIQRWALAVWGFYVRRPWLYRQLSAIKMWLLSKWGSSGLLRHIPLTGAWIKDRDLPAPTGTTFQRQWQNAQRSKARQVLP
jgi:L-lactate dehydrogenase complex protein LldF